MKQAHQQRGIQTIVATARMQQSIKILQMTSDELNQFLEQQAEQNPFFEINDNNLRIDHSNTNEDDNHNHWQQESYSRYEKCRSSSDSMENYIANQGKCLKEHILEQIQILPLDNAQQLLANILADNLDENGYLQLDSDDFCDKQGISQTYFEDLLRQLQQLEPSGVFARSINECIAIQLAERGKLNDHYLCLIDNLSLLAKGEITKLARMIKISESKLMKMIEEVKSIDPKPGRNFSSDNTRVKIPEGAIFFDTSGKLKAQLFNDYKRTIKINDTLYNKAISSCKTKDETKFCKEHMNIATWTHKAVIQRSETLLRVMQAIIDEQWEFLEKGVHFLKPMTLSDIARKLELHESTISRIANKYISTPFGTIEIKTLFSNSIATNYSDDLLSTKKVKEMIKNLIDNEQDVMSDDDIAEKLSELGVKISRRTVTKYREAMNIASSHERKRKRKINHGGLK